MKFTFHKYNFLTDRLFDLIPNRKNIVCYNKLTPEVIIAVPVLTLNEFNNEFFRAEKDFIIVIPMSGREPWYQINLNNNIHTCGEFKEIVKTYRFDNEQLKPAECFTHKSIVSIKSYDNVMELRDQLKPYHIEYYRKINSSIIDKFTQLYQVRDALKNGLLADKLLLKDEVTIKKLVDKARLYSKKSYSFSY